METYWVVSVFLAAVVGVEVAVAVICGWYVRYLGKREDARSKKSVEHLAKISEVHNSLMQRCTDIEGRVLNLEARMMIKK